MTRPSNFLAELANNVDALSGKYFTKTHKSEIKGRLRDIPREAVWSNAEIVLGGCAYFLEKVIAKPIYHLENLVLGREETSPSWTFGRD